MQEVKVNVKGMNCNHCKINVETGLKKLPGIDIALADIVNSEVTLKGNQIDLARVKSVVEDLGYLYNGEIK
jgi:copper chaperone